MNQPLRTLLLATAVFLLPGLTLAKPWWMRGVESNESDFLPPDDAFRVTSHVDGKTLQIRWTIANGYYLYRQRMAVTAESPDLVVTSVTFPTGVQKTDPFQGTQEIFTQQVDATARFTRSDGGAHPLQIKVTYQGCAEAGLCYPPITKVISPRPGVLLARTLEHPWEGYAIGAGCLAFLLSGLLLRKGRRLESPA